MKSISHPYFYFSLSALVIFLIGIPLVIWGLVTTSVESQKYTNGQVLGLTSDSLGTGKIIIAAGLLVITVSGGIGWWQMKKEQKVKL